ncbi:S8 family peptidase [Litoribacter alkaliphilus]|uniref:S8 family peptidase n=1 Tax=Litoribacter ruber TaxID=702568 RepID=A0AAP2G5L6_9BACT|nr:S8 family peptidase [Litoribacter alkaliphilus]MBS9525665.1 S8 family peptidase [Litoribacter alkaliphilus]
MNGFFKHIFLENKVRSISFTPLGTGRFKTNKNIDQTKHGNKLKNDFEEAFLDFWQGEPGDFVYVELETYPGFELDIKKFEAKAGDIRIASLKQVIKEDGKEKTFSTIYLSKKGVKDFLEKISAYSKPERNTEKGNPKNASLLSNLESIHQATLKSFWQEPEISFPDHEQAVWWEIWLDITASAAEAVRAEITERLQAFGVQISSRFMVFPEHLVMLAKGSAKQLAEPLLYSQYLDELRKPVEVSDVFTSMDIPEQRDWIANLAQQLEIQENSNLSVCLLDSGINENHPLLAYLNSHIQVDTVDPSWGTNDSWRFPGHGTAMSGIILFGDLSEALVSRESIRIFHRLESIKLIQQSKPTDPDQYGAVTEEAIARAETNPIQQRVFCMAITADGDTHFGRPSAWSAAIDKSAFGEEDWKRLILVSAGNIPNHRWLEYPLSNQDNSIHDPAQAFNALTIGAYTLKDRIDLSKYPGSTLLAQRGQLAPSSSTSMNWGKVWAIKPEVVFEGGNAAEWNSGLCDPDSLMPLSISKGGMASSLFSTFGETSSATAFASKFAVGILENYPNIWPETVRALMVHAAQWTDQMLGDRKIEDLSTVEKIQLLRTVGYGVPFLPAALYTLQNSVSLVVQETITPYKFESSRVQANECHVFTLPWPQDQLLEMGNTQVRLNVTLSYFIEPNPGNKRYAKANNYASFGLRFKLKDTNETSTTFLARINKEAREALEEDYQQEGRENWVIGQSIRDKGSIHRDIWIGNAADLATKNELAIIPTGGWWKTRTIHKRYNQSVRYSLIINIETDSEDLLTPILNKLRVGVEAI